MLKLHNLDSQSPVLGEVATITPEAVDQQVAAPGKWSRRFLLLRRVLAATALVFVLLVAWLAITAPLSKSLNPISPPQVTLLAANGTPIARMGADVEQPVEVSKLPKHVTQAF